MLPGQPAAASVALADVSFTTGLRRSHHDHRLAHRRAHERGSGDRLRHCASGGSDSTAVVGAPVPRTQGTGVRLLRAWDSSGGRWAGSCWPRSRVFRDVVGRDRRARSAMLAGWSLVARARGGRGSAIADARNGQSRSRRSSRSQVAAGGPLASLGHPARRRRRPQRRRGGGRLSFRGPVARRRREDHLPPEPPAAADGRPGHDARREPLVGGSQPDRRAA